MLAELHVRQLGVVEDLALLFGEGMTAVTGETGAGKTMLVEAIRLLVGGRAEPQVVRAGAQEASIEGRFILNGEEHILARVIPADGRSRAYIDGRMAPISALTELGERLVDLHGQHAHQALLSVVAQRRSLDLYGKVELDDVHEAQRRIADIDTELSGLGGDAQTRAREVDLLRFQLEELDVAQLVDVAEDDRLRDEVEALSDAGAHREAAGAFHEVLAAEGGVNDLLSKAVKLTAGRAPLESLGKRLQALSAELDDITAEAAGVSDGLQDDPERLEAVQERRQLIKQLQRKYGPSVADVIAFHSEARRRFDDLERHDERVRELEAARRDAAQTLVKAQEKVRKARVKAAPKLAGEVQKRLRDLALPHARFEIQVGASGAGDEVVFLLGPNPGMPLLPVAKAASGGELARSMLALRLALLGAGDSTADMPPTLIFDEVDAGIGGEAAQAVGKSLGDLAHGGRPGTQVFVVTHLPQVAAYADQQITVAKHQGKGSTTAQVEILDLNEREVELARMLSGRPDSDSGRAHARELLQQAKRA